MGALTQGGGTVLLGIAMGGSGPEVALEDREAVCKIGHEGQLDVQTFLYSLSGQGGPCGAKPHGDRL